MSDDTSSLALVPIDQPAAVAAVIPPSPCTTGFGCVWFNETKQVLTNYNTMEWMIYDVTDFALHEEDNTGNDGDDDNGPEKFREAIVSWTDKGAPFFSEENADGQSGQVTLAYKFFDLQKMVRSNKTWFYWSMKEKKALVVTYKFEENTYESDTFGDFLLWQFSMPPLDARSKMFIRCRDVQAALGFTRSDQIDRKWLMENWQSWEVAWQKEWGMELPGFCSEESAAWRHKHGKKEGEEYPEPALGKKCLESWAMTFLAILWWLMRIAKGIKKSPAADRETKRCKDVFEQFVSIVLQPAMTYLCPLSLAQDQSNSARQDVPTNKPIAFLNITGGSITDLSGVFNNKKFFWLKSALGRQRFANSELLESEQVYIYIYI